MSPWLSDVFLRSQSDERLVNLARGGHDRAFAAIVERYRRQLQALARRLCSDGRAEDIVQQTFLSALTALRGGAEVRHLRGWLHQILRHTAVRSAASTPLETAFDETSLADDADPDPLERRLLALSALAEVARLPSRQRDAFVGTALHGHSRAEIAGSMGLSEGAVRQLVHRARATVRGAVTAVTPYPLAEWLGTSGGSVGGVGLKLGAVVISGVLTTGIVSSSLHRHPASHRAATLAAGPHSAPAPGPTGLPARATDSRLSGSAVGITGGLMRASGLRGHTGSSTSRRSVVPAVLVSIRGEHAQGPGPGSGSGDGSGHGSDGSGSAIVGSGHDGAGSGHGETQGLTHGGAGGGEGPSSGDGAGSRAGAPATVGVQASVEGSGSGADHGSGSGSSGSDHGSSSTGAPSSALTGSGVPSGGDGH